MAKKEMKNSPPDSLLKFGTGGVRGRQGEGLGFSSTVDPPEDTEVYRLLNVIPVERSLLVYSGKLSREKRFCGYVFSP